MEVLVNWTQTGRIVLISCGLAMDPGLERWRMEVPRVFRERKAPSLYAELFGSMQSSHARCSVVAAHPDDEIVGCGCLIAKLSNVGILHVSNGAPHSVEEARAAGFDTIQDYALARQRECLAALALAQVSSEQVLDLNFGQLEASSNLVPLTWKLVSFLQRTSPQIVLTHAYEGGHPDHDATAFCTHAAVRLLREHGLKPPIIFEMALYPGSNGMSKVPEFLYSTARESTTLVPDRKARDLKLRMFDCFESQKQFLDKSPLGPEKFRQAPAYDFRLPPQEGKLHFEKFSWGMTGDTWRALACQAWEELFVKRDLGAN